MKVAFGLKAHSGWAALVVIGENNGGFVVVDRQRITLAEEDWARQPYHAAENLPRESARDLVKRGIADANRMALLSLKTALKQEHQRNHEVKGCGVLVNDPMPQWTTDEILAVHFRMHKAEGVMFRSALVDAARKCKLRLFAIHEKSLKINAAEVLGVKSEAIDLTLRALGEGIGPPWTKDQKDAALAAMVALKSASE